MTQQFDGLAFSPADVLLPQNCAYGKWSVVACDQYTSQPEYWQRVEETVGAAPSALRLILPESCLDGPNVETDIVEVNNTMTRYLREGCFRELPESLIYVERRLSNGRLRRGLVGKVDLEQYDYEPGAAAQVRATEGTVLSRIPPRVAVRKNAPLELPHVMLLTDDPDKTVIEPLTARKGDFEALYDFELMEHGGRVSGWRLDRAAAEQVAAALRALADPAAFNARYGTQDEPVLLFAVGDGNHSLATAKECYERQKRLTSPDQWTDLPARYALCELVNLHDASLEFEPIHRVAFGVEPEALLEALLEAYPGAYSGEGEGHRLRSRYRAPSSGPTGGGHASELPGRVHPPAWGPRRLHPRRRRDAGALPQAGQPRLPAARHGQAAAVSHRDPRRGPPPQNLLHGGGPRQALLSGSAEDPLIAKEEGVFPWQCWKCGPMPS